MDIQFNPENINRAHLNTEPSNLKQEKVATAFEEIFARQLMTEMTKGLFKQDDNGILGAGSNLYRMHVVDTLSHELAKQHKLGIANKVMHYFNQKLDHNNDGRQ